MRNKNKAVNSIDELVNKNEALNAKMERLQKEKDLKLNKIDNNYQNKIDRVLRQINFNEMQMKQAHTYANKILGGK